MYKINNNLRKTEYRNQLTTGPMRRRFEVCATVHGFNVIKDLVSMVKGNSRGETRTGLLKKGATRLQAEGSCLSDTKERAVAWPILQCVQGAIREEHVSKVILGRE